MTLDINKLIETNSRVDKNALEQVRLALLELRRFSHKRSKLPDSTGNEAAENDKQDSRTMPLCY